MNENGKEEDIMKVKIVQKKDEYSMEYNVGDILEVDSTWYGGVTVLGKTGVPVSIDKDEYVSVTDAGETSVLDTESEQKTIAENVFQGGLKPKGQGVSTEHFGHLAEIEQEVRGAVRDLLAVANLEPGDALVIGCSSSEVANMRIGSFSSEEIGKCIASAILDELTGTGIYMAAQCCEHLNRAVIVEKAYAKENRIPIVNVVPQIKAGGSFATAAYADMKEPVAIEYIQAQAGIDIGDTLIGMHLAPVAVPVRAEHSMVGGARVVMARTRAKYIGGIRAGYREGI